MEVVSQGFPFTVVVDYADTPAGLDVALAAARGLAGSGRVIACSAAEATAIRESARRWVRCPSGGRMPSF